MMESDKVQELLSNEGVVIRGSHFVYTSGKHGSVYLNKDAIYSNPLITSELCERIARLYIGFSVEVVAAPAIGGAILAQWTAYHLSLLSKTRKKRVVRAVFAEKAKEGGFEFRRGYDLLLPDKRVLVVEDVLTTGTSARKVVDEAHNLGATVIGVGALFNRGGLTARDFPNAWNLKTVSDVVLDSWEEAKCPLCADEVPINQTVGKGREFLARRGLQDPA